LDEVLESLDHLGALDDISLLEIGEEARALHGVAEARVPPCAPGATGSEGAHGCRLSSEGQLRARRAERA